MREPRDADRRRRPYLAWLVVLGSLAVIAGVVWVQAAKTAADQYAQRPQPMPTLPVHVYAQYTQHAIVPDYSGLWMGFAVVGVGVLILAAGIVGAMRDGLTERTA